MQILFFEIYTRGHFTVQGIRHSINTVPTMVLGEAFRIVIRHPPFSPFPHRKGIHYLSHAVAFIMLFYSSLELWMANDPSWQNSYIWTSWSLITLLFLAKMVLSRITKMCVIIFFSINLYGFILYYPTNIWSMNDIILIVNILFMNGTSDMFMQIIHVDITLCMTYQCST